MTEKYKCKYAEDKSGNVYECNGYYTREVECPFQYKDLNPDGTVNICECKKYEVEKMTVETEVKEKTCANCREWFINGIGERDCLQIHCEDYSDWVERPKDSEVEK